MDCNGIFGADQEGSAAKLGKPVAENPVKFLGHAATDFLPGFCSTSTTQKADDSNLSPFEIYNPKTIQYGDTSITSICTDDPTWSAGECKFLSKYEGRFRRKSYIMSSKVKF